MLSEKGILEPAIVGIETKGKLRRRCRVPNKMDCDIVLLWQAFTTTKCKAIMTEPVM